MKISEKLTKAINDQINAEQWSAQFYLSMALEASDRNLTGTAAWMMSQAREEQDHAEQMINYLQTRGVRPILQMIKEVPSNFGDVIEMFEVALKHEKQVTKLVHNIVDLAIEEKDYGCEDFFRAFVTEQEEEEETFSTIIDRFRIAGPHGLIFVDHHLETQRLSEPKA